MRHKVDAAAHGGAAAHASASGPQAHPDATRESGPVEGERLTRQQAAERLIDIAYSLAAGGSLELSIAGNRVMVPVPNELHLSQSLRHSGERVGLELNLTWSGSGA